MTARPGVSAARGGSELAVATLVSLAGNYVFLLAAGRLLGSVDYGTLAALTGLLTVVLLPSSALQMAVAREVSSLEALGDHERTAGFVRNLLRLGVLVTAAVVGLGFALLLPIQELLNLSAVGPVALTLAGLVIVVANPVALGVLQGQQRFRTLAAVTATPMLIRVVAFAGLALLGLRLYGALVAITISAVLAVGVALAAVLVRLPRSGEALPIRPFLRTLVPIAVGLFGVTILTNADILVVKARFSGEEAGVYAAASAFARVAFFLPSALVAVLIPRTAARHARGQAAEDILGRSLIITLSFCGALTAGYALFGRRAIDLTYGDEFAGAAGLLLPFCLAMTLFSITNVIVVYHLSRQRTGFAWFVALAGLVQVLALATLPSTPREVLWVNAVIGGALLVAHEVLEGSSTRALAAGYRRMDPWRNLRRAALAIGLSRPVVVEAAVVLLGFAGVAVIASWPLVLDFGSAMPGPFPNDGSGTAGWFWQLTQEGGYGLLGSTQHTLTGAPLGWEQGNALNFQWLIPYYPGYLFALAFGPVVATNLVALSGLALSGASMYLLVRWIGCGRLPAAWAGLVFTIFPWHIERVIAGHASLVHLELFPLLVMASLAWIRRPSEGRSALVALVVIAQWLTSGYFGAMAFIVIGAFSVVAFALQEGGGRRAMLREGAKMWAMALSGAGIVILGSILAGSSAGVNVGRDAGEVEFYGARLADYLPDPANPVVGGIAERVVARPGYYAGAESLVYPGLVTIGLALLWVLFLRRGATAGTGRRVTVPLAAVAVTGVICAAPSPMNLFGLSVHPMPSYVLFKVLPAFRVPSRLIVVILVALLPLAALALERLLRGRRADPRVRRRVAVAVAFVAVCAASVAELGIPMKQTAPRPTPGLYEAVAVSPAGPIAEYPLWRSGTPANSQYVYWQRLHARPLVNGAAPGSPADGIRRMLVDPSERSTAGSLALLGVHTIVTRTDTLAWVERARAAELASYGSGYRLARTLVDGTRVWRVIAAPAPALAVLRPGDVGEPLPGSSADKVVHPVVTPSVHVDIYARSAATLVLRIDTRGLRLPSRAVLRGTGEAVVVALDRSGALRIPVDVPRGRSTLTVDFDPGAGDAEMTLSTPWFEAARESESGLDPVRLFVDSGFS